MGTGLNKFQGALNGNRKIVIFVVACVSSIGAYLIGDMAAMPMIEKIWHGAIGAFAANGVEHLAGRK